MNISAPMTPAEIAAECRVIYETRIAILREPEGCGGEATPAQVQIAVDEVNEFKRRHAKAEHQKLI